MAGAADVTRGVQKFVVAILGVLAQALTLGLVPDDIKSYVVVIVSVATAVGVFAVPNRPQPSRGSSPLIVP